jgi:DNA-directed RNA polymerase subunit H
MAKFKVSDHFLVPEHILLDKKEEEKVLNEFKITKEHLPKIRQSDPCIRAIEAKGETVEPGMMVRIIRKSDTAGEAVAYRVVVEG